MLSSLKRLFGGSALRPAPVVSGAADATPGVDEWTSFDMDPELAKFGAARDGTVVPAEALEQSTPSAPTGPAEAAVAAARSTEPLILLDLLPADEPAPAVVEDVVEAPIATASAPAPEEPVVEVTVVFAPTPDTREPVATTAAAEGEPLKSAPKKREPANKRVAAKKTVKKAGVKKSAPKKSPSKAAAAPNLPAAPRRSFIAGASLTKGAWRLPGVDGWSGVETNDSVETAQLDLVVTGSAT